MSDNKSEIADKNSEEYLHRLRHSTTHVMAQAVMRLFDNVKLGIGPVIENGFYYDFELNHNFTDEDLKAIEKEMLKIVNEQQSFVCREISVADAKAELKDQPFKLELIETKSQNADGTNKGLTMYDNVDKSGKTVWTDLCQGPHIENTKEISNSFKVTRQSGAYWLGKETNPQLQRIYGTAFPTKQELNDYLQMMEEAKKRDHRKLGKEMDLIAFPEELGSGLSVFLPKGEAIREEMETYSKLKHIEHGYSKVKTPHITKSNLYEISGHLGWYKEGMYPPMKLDEEVDNKGNVTKEGFDYYLKPMNCPMHNLIFRERARSYKELPLRLFEFGTVYRYEKSGVVHGMSRARGFTQDDAHIYCTTDQMKDELKSLLKFMLDLLADYGLNDFYLEISTKDPKKYVGDDEVWETATKTLEEVAAESKLELKLDEAGAAFYGPKISVQAKDAIGRYWQMSTIQLDFNLPERFDLKYQAADGTLQRPVMIHRALFGSVERFFAVLLEHYAGLFPLWLAPVQVRGISVAEEFEPYVKEFINELHLQGFRVEMDYTDDRFNKKIRNSQKDKIPVTLIAGENDYNSKSFSLRLHDGTQMNSISKNEVIDYLKNTIKNKS
jgi:threonyl-tRNA synthetase